MGLVHWLARRSWGTGILFGCALSLAAAGALVYLVFVISFGGHVEAIAGFERVVPGMDHQGVERILGPEDGVLRGRTLADYDRRRWERSPARDYEALEQAAGRHLLWLSRCRTNPLGEDSVIFNVVSFDAQDRVVGTFTGVEAFLGHRD